MSARVHQVLATLGYGDAIGHEVLGIQRVLHDAGSVSYTHLTLPTILRV